MTITRQLDTTIESLPSTPGVYQMLNDKEDIIYIGKAKDLKKRVKSYFQKSKNHSVKTKKLVENIVDIKCIETNSELEALILETNLIKENRPKYNILMKDDKNYVYIKVTNEDFPQICTVRKRLKDGAKYFGPKTSGMAVKQTLKFLNRLFPYRTCTFDIQETPEGPKLVSPNRKIPCLDYHINRCIGPCVGAVSKADYRKIIDQIVNFLEGKHKPILDSLKESMKEAAMNKDFEKAAKLRDQVEYIQMLNEKQLVSDVNIVDRDTIGYIEHEKQIFVNLFQIREGKIINQENFILNKIEEGGEILSSFLKNYYSEATDIPKEVLIPKEIEDQKVIETWLKDLAGHSVKIIVPQKGQKNKLIELSEKNAQTFMKQQIASWSLDEKKQSYEKVLESLQEKLGLTNLPSRMECYDISHLAGTLTVGSMVVFKNGKSSKKDYRRFKIESLKKGEIDDYKAMQEVLKRRLGRLALQGVQKNDYEFRKGLKKDIIEIEKILKKEKMDSKEIKASDFVVALKNYKIAAFGRVTKYEDKTLQLRSLWVGKKYQKEKLGWKLMKKLFDNFKGKDIHVLTKNGEEYYEEFGFRKLTISIPEILKKEMKKGMSCMKFKIPKESSFDELPDLMIIDGGKGQLSTAYEVMQNLKLEIDMIALAKREEEVFKPGEKVSIILDKKSPELYLLQRIRDEAHRFAISYNKSLRKKSDHKSALDSIPGIGPKTKKKLLQTFGSVKEIKETSLEELSKVCDTKLAQKILESLK